MKNLWPSISTSRCSMNSVRTNGFVPRFAPKSFTKHGWLIWLMMCISWIKSLVASNKRFVFAGSMFLSDQSVQKHQLQTHAHCSTTCLCLWHTVWESQDLRTIPPVRWPPVQLTGMKGHGIVANHLAYSLAIPMPGNNHVGSTLDLPLLIVSLHNDL